MSAPTFLEPNPNYLNYSTAPFSSNIIPDYDYSCYQDLDFFCADNHHLFSDDFTSSNDNNTFGYPSSDLPQTPLVLPEKSNNSTTGSSSCSSDGMPTSTNYMPVYVSSPDQSSIFWDFYVFFFGYDFDGFFFTQYFAGSAKGRR